MKQGKPVRQLPTRGALKDLDASQRTIIDYSKASPIKPLMPAANIIQKLRDEKQVR